MASVLVVLALVSLVGLLSVALLSNRHRSRADLEYTIRVQRRIDQIANTR